MSRLAAISDTSPEALRVLIDCYRRMPIERKWRVMLDSYRTARTLHEAGFRLRQPVATAQQVQADWRKLALGPTWQSEFRKFPSVDASSLDNLPELREVISVFRDRGIPCALGGSCAGYRQGLPRMAQHADRLDA